MSTASARTPRLLQHMIQIAAMRCSAWCPRSRSGTARLRLQMVDVDRHSALAASVTSPPATPPPLLVSSLTSPLLGSTLVSSGTASTLASASNGRTMTMVGVRQPPAAPCASSLPQPLSVFTPDIRPRHSSQLPRCSRRRRRRRLVTHRHVAGRQTSSSLADPPCPRDLLPSPHPLVGQQRG